MNDPIPISKEKPEKPTLTTEDYLALSKAKHLQRQQWAFLGLVGFIVVGFLTPLFVWLTRLALGG